MSNVGKWTDGGIFTVFLLNAIIYVVIIAIFSVVRRRFSAVYFPRADHNKEVVVDIPDAFFDGVTNEDTHSSASISSSAASTSKATTSESTSKSTTTSSSSAPDSDTTALVTDSGKAPSKYADAPETLFAWITDTWRIEDHDMLLRVGFESTMYIKFQRMALRLVGITAILTAPVLVPVNLTGTFNEEKFKAETDQDVIDGYRTGFPDWTVSNMDENDPKLWVHTVVLFILTFVFSSLAAEYAHDYYTTRLLYRSLKKAGVSPEAHSILVDNLPYDLRDAGLVKSTFERFYPGKVLSASLAYRTPALIKAHENLAKAELGKLNGERMLDKAHYLHEKATAEGKEPKPVERPMTKVGGFLPPLTGKKVDAIEHFTAEVAKFKAEIASEAAKDDHPSAGVAFVTFKDAITARYAVQNFKFKLRPTNPFGEDVLLSQLSKDDEGKYMRKMLTRWDVMPSPPPEDVFWKNLPVRGNVKLGRAIIFGACTLALVLLWTTVLSFLGNVDKLATSPGFSLVFSWLLDLPPVIAGFLSAYLPTIVLIVFNILLPGILTAFAKNEGIKSNSQLMTAVLSKYYIFVLFAIMILPSFVSGIMGELNGLADKLANETIPTILNIIVKVVTPTSGMFIAYMTQQALIGTAVAFLRIGPLIVGWLKTRGLPRDRFGAWIDDLERVAVFDYHLNYPVLLLFLSITMFFCITMPIVTPFGVAYFALRHLVDKYALYFIHPPAGITDHSMPAQAIRLAALVQVIMTAGTFGIFLGKRAVGPAIVALILLLLTIKAFFALGKYLDMVTAEDMYINLEVEGKDEGPEEHDIPGLDVYREKLICCLEYSNSTSAGDVAIDVDGKSVSAIPPLSDETSSGADGGKSAASGRKSDPDASEQEMKGAVDDDATSKDDGDFMPVVAQ